MWYKRRLKMTVFEERETHQPDLMESVFVEMDPVVHGFAGVLVELSRVGKRYVLRQTAVGSGNRLLKIDLESEGLARALFEEELGRA
jgi:hypothetical protein